MIFIIQPKLNYEMSSGGAIGGMVDGFAGYRGADWVADYIYEN